ncbi:MAG: hypothetical protein J5819_03975 [Eubacterium sp.]|nr:hypothetical protein [Eubacterium sp.]
MESTYCEWSVKRRKTVASLVIKVLMIAVVIALMLSTVILPWFAIGGLVAAGFVIWYWPRFDIMWEYVYVDGQIDFDEIFGGEKRKTVLRIEIEEADAVAPADSEKLAGYRHLPVKNFTSLEEGARVYGIATRIPGKEEKVLIMFEPSDKMLDMIRDKAPRIIER